MSWTNVISDLNGKEIVETLYKKELKKKKKKIQKEVESWKLIRKKVINYMLNGKSTIIRLKTG